MSEAKERLNAIFARLEITPRKVSHEPVFTMEAMDDFAHRFGGYPCKNLLFFDDKSSYWLLSMVGAEKVPLKSLAKHLNVKKIAFAKPEQLLELLGVNPGSVTPFALINDTEKKVKYLIDSRIFDEKEHSFHPLSNDESWFVTGHQLICFVKELTIPYSILEIEKLHK